MMVFTDCFNEVLNCGGWSCLLDGFRLFSVFCVSVSPRYFLVGLDLQMQNTSWCRIDIAFELRTSMFSGVLLRVPVAKRHLLSGLSVCDCNVITGLYLSSTCTCVS